MTILTGTFMGACFLMFYLLGIRHGEARVHKDVDGVEVTDDNKESIKHFLEWINYGGR